jgi:hypothetical protein
MIPKQSVEEFNITGGRRTGKRPGHEFLRSKGLAPGQRQPRGSDADGGACPNVASGVVPRGKNDLKPPSALNLRPGGKQLDAGGLLSVFDGQLVATDCDHRRTGRTGSGNGRGDNLEIHNERKV